MKRLLVIFLIITMLIPSAVSADGDSYIVLKCNGLENFTTDDMDFFINWMYNKILRLGYPLATIDFNENILITVPDVYDESALTDIYTALTVKSRLTFTDTEGNVILSNEDGIKRVSVEDSNVMRIEFTDAGRQTFATATERISQQAFPHNMIAIVFDGKIISNPMITGKIDNDTAKFTGQFSDEDAYYFVTAIAVGQLSFTLDLIEKHVTKDNSVFKDVPSSHWAFKYINDLAAMNVLNGYGDGNFGPEDTITRAQLATIICKTAGIKPIAVTESLYIDVPVNEWYAPFVEGANSYVNFYNINGEKLFKPEENAVREDVTVAVVKLMEYDTSRYNEDKFKQMFTDWEEISSDARKYIYAAAVNGVVTGYEDGTFRGQTAVTRAEAATLVWRGMRN